MPKCSVCKKNYEFPEGLTFVHVDGRVLHFCSGKCRKNHEMGRKKLRWVAKQKGTGKLEAVEEESAKAGAKEKPAEAKEEKKEEKKADAKPKEEKKEEKKETQNKESKAEIKEEKK